MGMLTRRNFLKVAGMGTVSAALLAACGSSDSGSQTAESTETAATSSEETSTGDGTTTSVEVAASDEKPEGWTEADATETIVYHLASQTHTLCKWETTAGDMLNISTWLMYDPILMKDEEGNIVPWLATEWNLADDYLSIDFTFRDDVYFTNGVHMTAEDIAYTFELLRDDSEHYPDSVAKTWRNYLGELEVTGDYSMTMHFTQPMPTLYSNLCNAYTCVIPKSTVEEMGWDAFWAAPVGSGPYKLKSADLTNSILEFELRDDENGYWGYKYSGRYTNVKTQIWEYSAESTTRIASLQTGEVQIIDNVPTSELASLSSYSDIAINVLPASNEVFLQVACGEGDSMENQLLCEAISLAIDRDLLVEQLLDGYGVAAKCGAADETWLAYNDVEDLWYEYDPDRAAELVAESGYDGRELRFVYTLSTVSNGNEVAQAIQQMLLGIGINLSLEPLDVSLYDTAREDRDFDIVMANIGCSSPYNYNVYAQVIGEDKFNTGLQNEEMKALGVQVQSIVDYDDLEPVLAEIMTYEQTEFQPNLYVYYAQKIFASASGIAGVLLHNGATMDFSALTYNPS